MYNTGCKGLPQLASLTAPSKSRGPLKPPSFTREVARSAGGSAQDARYAPLAKIHTKRKKLEQRPRRKDILEILPIVYYNSCLRGKANDFVVIE